MANTVEYIYEVLDRFSGPLKKFERSTQKSEASMQRLNNRVAAATRLSEKYRRQSDQLRGQLIDTAAAAYLLSRPIKAAMEFEASMADIRKVVDFDTPEQFKQMGLDIREMSKRIPLAASGLADIVAAAGQAGMVGTELLGFAEIASKSAVAFDIFPAEAGENLAKIKTALSLTVAETEALADTINHLSNSSASSAPDILNFMRRVGALGKQYGFTADQTMAIGSAMIAAGHPAEIAATSFRNVGRMLARGAGASKDQQRAFRMLGLNAKEVARSLNEDAVGTLSKVVEGIRKLPEHLQASTMSRIFGDEARAIAALVANADALPDALSLIADKTKMAGSVTREFETRIETSEAKFQLFKNTLNDLQIAFGDALLPSVNASMGAISGLLKPIGWLLNNVPGLSFVISNAAAALIVLRIATVAYQFAVIQWKLAMLTLTRGLMLAKIAMIAFNAVMYANPIGLIVGGIALLVAGIAALIIYWDDVSAAMSNAYQAMLPIIDAIRWIITNPISAVMKAVGMVIPGQAENTAERKERQGSLAVNGGISVTATPGTKVESANISLNGGSNIATAY